MPVDCERFEKLLAQKVAGSKVKTGMDMTYETSHAGTGERI